MNVKGKMSFRCFIATHCALLEDLQLCTHTHTHLRSKLNLVSKKMALDRNFKLVLVIDDDFMQSTPEQIPDFNFEEKTLLAHAR